MQKSMKKKFNQEFKQMKGGFFKHRRAIRFKRMKGGSRAEKWLRKWRARQYMLRRVPIAAVVIQDPGHVAVALRYQDRYDAPFLVAEGTYDMALRIVKRAERNGVAVVENASLAQALDAQTMVNKFIPPDLYDPVAEVLVKYHIPY